MKFLNDIKVGTKITILAVSLLLCIATVAGVGIYELRQLDEQSDTLYENNMLALGAVKEANVQLVAMSRTVMNMALANEGRAAYGSAYEALVAAARGELEKVRARLLTAESKSLFTRADEAFTALLPEQRDVIENMERRSPEETFQRLAAARKYAMAADSLMSELGVSISKAGEARSREMSAAADRGFIISTSVLLLALALGAVLGVLIKKAIATPLASITHRAVLVAQGDLDQEFALDRKDELGSLSAALDQMVATLRVRIAESEQKSAEAEEQSNRAMEAMSEARAAQEKAEERQVAILEAAENVEQVVNRLAVATEELSAQVEESSRGAEQSRDRVTSAATAMEQMNATVLDVARNAGVAAEGSETARENAGLGQSIVQESIASINTVQEDTRELRENMENLGEQTEAIGAILTVISDIADQTNLLALNAAIEAARAGEAGRGFAVVADEVRKLAEKTMEATKEVGSAISGIQNGATQSIRTVERTTANLDGTTELVKKSGEALDVIVHEISETSGQVSSIAAAAEEQSAASESITLSLEEINSMAEQTASVMQESAQAVVELARQSQQLQELVNDLRRG